MQAQAETEPKKSPAKQTAEPGKLAAQLRAELEVHKEALSSAKDEIQTLSESLGRANSFIEVLLDSSDA